MPWTPILFVNCFSTIKNVLRSNKYTKGVFVAIPTKIHVTNVLDNILLYSGWNCCCRGHYRHNIILCICSASCIGRTWYYKGDVAKKVTFCKVSHHHRPRHYSVRLRLDKNGQRNKRSTREAIWCRVSLVPPSRRDGEKKNNGGGAWGWLVSDGLTWLLIRREPLRPFHRLATSTNRYNMWHTKAGTLSIPTGLNYYAHQRHMSPKQNIAISPRFNNNNMVKL